MSNNDRIFYGAVSVLACIGAATVSTFFVSKLYDHLRPTNAPETAAGDVMTPPDERTEAGGASHSSGIDYKAVAEYVSPNDAPAETRSMPEPGARQATPERLGSFASPGFIPTAPDYEASYERYLQLGAEMAGILETPLDELPDVDSELWDAWPQYAYLIGYQVACYTDASTLGKALPELQPIADLERAWKLEETPHLWETHQELFADQYRLQVMLQELQSASLRGNVTVQLGLVQVQLDEVRRALWSGTGDPVYLFLYELGKEME